MQSGDILRFTHVDNAEGISLPFVAAILQPAISCATRARLLHLQKDRLHIFHMPYSDGSSSAVSCPAPHEAIEFRLRELRLHSEFGVIGALPIAGHWVAFAWMSHDDSVAAWKSFAPRVADGTANCIMGRATVQVA